MLLSWDAIGSARQGESWSWQGVRSSSVLFARLLCPQNVREEEHRLVCQRCSFLEERMSKLEALVAVLPTWKEDLVSSPVLQPQHQAAPHLALGWQPQRGAAEGTDRARTNVAAWARVQPCPEPLCCPLPCAWLPPPRSRRSQMSKMDTLAREGRVRHEQVSMRTQMLEDQVSQNAQAARERLDHLTQLGRTLTEARAAHGERMDGLEKQIRQVDAAHGYSIKSLEDAKDGERGQGLTVTSRPCQQGARAPAHGQGGRRSSRSAAPSQAKRRALHAWGCCCCRRACVARVQRTRASSRRTTAS